MSFCWSPPYLKDLKNLLRLTFAFSISSHYKLALDEGLLVFYHTPGNFSIQLWPFTGISFQFGFFPFTCKIKDGFGNSLMLLLRFLVIFFFASDRTISFIHSHIHLEFVLPLPVVIAEIYFLHVSIVKPGEMLSTSYLIGGVLISSSTSILALPLAIGGHFHFNVDRYMLLILSVRAELTLL